MCRMTFASLLVLILTALSPTSRAQSPVHNDDADGPYLIVLGTVQDGGSPHIGCARTCCADLFANPDASRKVVSLGIVDPIAKRKFLVEATPDITTQLHTLSGEGNFASNIVPDGILITHAHIGHYTGLMHLGKEALNAHTIPVYTMPRMTQFLRQHGPWSQLVSMQNIQLFELDTGVTLELTAQLQVRPLLVPHRDEFSETVGFMINGPRKTALFIPDIDKWTKWDKSLIDLLQSVDYAFIDGTFFDAAEVNYRDITQIPHPFVIETMTYLADLPLSERNKVHFIHFNHTNPLLNPENPAYHEVIKRGFHIARFGQQFRL